MYIYIMYISVCVCVWYGNLQFRFLKWPRMLGCRQQQSWGFLATRIDKNSTQTLGLKQHKSGVKQQ